MLKLVCTSLTALFVAVPATSFAETPAAVRALLTEAAAKALIDQRLDVIKIALGLTAEQEKLWPPVEEAIRGRLTARHQRLSTLTAMQSRDAEFAPIQAMRERSDALAQRSAALKKLADAWQPLYATLDTNQKLRLRFVAVFVLREMRDAIQTRLLEAEDADDLEE